MRKIISLLQCILIPVVLFLIALLNFTAIVVGAVILTLLAYTALGVYYISDIMTKLWNKSRF